MQNTIAAIMWLTVGYIQLVEQCDADMLLTAYHLSDRGHWDRDMVG